MNTGKKGNGNRALESTPGVGGLLDTARWSGTAHAAFPVGVHPACSEPAEIDFAAVKLSRYVCACIEVH